MARRASDIVLAPLSFARYASLPLAARLYRALREAILDGRLPAQARLPATRVLARTLEVSRGAVVTAYEQLSAEGYTESWTGSGTRVARRVAPPRSPAARAAAPRLAELAHRLPEPSSGYRGALCPFKTGTPAIDAAPLAVLGRLLRAACLDAAASTLDYGDALGVEELRAALAERLFRTRAIACDAAQIAIVSGTQQALDLAARLLLDPGDEAWVEDPGYLGARGALTAAGARLAAVRVDAEGLDAEWGERRAPSAKLAYVTPSHQYPLGVTMSLRRRLTLLGWAQRTGGWVIEDDYDSDFRYEGQPVAALYGLAKGESVIYIGTFSKTLFPALRLGFVVLPVPLVEPFRAVRHFADSFPPTLVQRAAAHLLSEGHYDRHLRRLLGTYRERRDALLAGARRHLAGLAEVEPVEAGLHAVAWLPRGVCDGDAALAAAAAGVDTIALSACALRPLERGGLVLGFAAFTPEQIEAGLRRLASALAGLREAVQ